MTKSEVVKILEELRNEALSTMKYIEEDLFEDPPETVKEVVDDGDYYSYQYDQATTHAEKLNKVLDYLNEV